MSNFTPTLERISGSLSDGSQHKLPNCLALLEEECTPLDYESDLRVQIRVGGIGEGIV